MLCLLETTLSTTDRCVQDDAVVESHKKNDCYGVEIYMNFVSGLRGVFLRGTVNWACRFLLHNVWFDVQCDQSSEYKTAC